MRPTYIILLIYPNSKQAEIEAWYASQFPNAGSLLTKLPTVSGEWYAASFSASKEDAQKWLNVFGVNLGTEVPQRFTELPRETQLAWITQMQQVAKQSLGIWIDAIFYEKGKFPSLEPGLAAMNIQLKEEP